VSGDIKIGDRFYPTDDPAAVYTVSAVSRFGHRITHVTLTADSDQLAVTVSVGEIFDACEWEPTK